MRPRCSWTPDTWWPWRTLTTRTTRRLASIGRTLQHARAVELGEMLLGSPSVKLVHAGEDLLRRGFGLLRDRPDKGYSLTDCVSFVVMPEREISVAFAFDRHFEQEGFVREPRRR